MKYQGRELNKVYLIDDIVPEGLNLAGGCIKPPVGGSVMVFKINALRPDISIDYKAIDPRMLPLTFFDGGIPFTEEGVPALSKQVLDGGEFTQLDLDSMVLGGHYLARDIQPVVIEPGYRERFSGDQIRQRFERKRVGPEGITFVQRHKFVYRFYVSGKDEYDLELVARLFDLSEGEFFYLPNLPEGYYEERLPVLAEFVRDFERVMEVAEHRDAQEFG